jgi:hypothetical protein
MVRYAGGILLVVSWLRVGLGQELRWGASR